MLSIFIKIYSFLEYIKNWFKLKNFGVKSNSRIPVCANSRGHPDNKFHSTNYRLAKIFFRRTKNYLSPRENFLSPRENITKRKKIVKRSQIFEIAKKKRKEPKKIAVFNLCENMTKIEKEISPICKSAKKRRKWANKIAN